jgi:broad specificity phosphatase PhoE
MTGNGGTDVRTRLLLVRHGETEYNARSIFRRTLDIPLSAIGLEEARLTGQGLSTTKLAGIVSSPLARALETARQIAVCQSERIEPVIDAAFTDLNFGE